MCLRARKQSVTASVYLSSAITLIIALNRLSSFKNLRRKGGKCDHRPGRPKVLLRHWDWFRLVCYDLTMSLQSSVACLHLFITCCFHAEHRWSQSINKHDSIELDCSQVCSPTCYRQRRSSSTPSLCLKNKSFSSPSFSSPAFSGDP